MSRSMRRVRTNRHRKASRRKKGRMMNRRTSWSLAVSRQDHVLIFFLSLSPPSCPSFPLFFLLIFLFLVFIVFLRFLFILAVVIIVVVRRSSSTAAASVVSISSVISAIVSRQGGTIALWGKGTRPKPAKVGAIVRIGEDECRLCGHGSG